MAITITIFEDSGPLLNGKGTNRTAVTNIGWKSNGLDETDPYIYGPLIRPEGDTPFTYSFKKYNFLKIEGTYPIASRPRIKFTGNYNGAPPQGYEKSGANQVRLYYKLTNEYETPNNDWDGSLMYLPPGVTQTVYPAMSVVGPELATTYPQYLIGNITYYTQYLVTQLLVPAGTSIDFGNIGELNIEWFFDEYEGTNV